MKIFCTSGLLGLLTDIEGGWVWVVVSKNNANQEGGGEGPDVPGDEGDEGQGPAHSVHLCEEG